MKAITREWLDRAKDDLLAAGLLLIQPELTNMVAFHAQQTVDKSLMKACLEEADIAAVKTHSLTRLYGFAQHVYERIQTVLETDEDSDSPSQEKDL